MLLCTSNPKNRTIHQKLEKVHVLVLTLVIENLPRLTIVCSCSPAHLPFKQQHQRFRIQENIRTGSISSKCVRPQIKYSKMC